MKRLEELWNIGEQQIDMKTLCYGLNRFVCAGIFFELMSKKNSYNLSTYYLLFHL